MYCYITYQFLIALINVPRCLGVRIQSVENSEQAPQSVLRNWICMGTEGLASAWMLHPHRLLCPILEGPSWAEAQVERMGTRLIRKQVLLDRLLDIM